MTDEQMIAVSDILKRRLTMLTSGTSSSLPQKTVETTLASILYCIEVSESDTDTAIALDNSSATQARYEAGLEKLKRTVSEAKRLLTRLKVCRFKTPCLAYNDTLAHGLPEFFASYDVYFAANEPCGAIDYPLALPVCDERGAIGAIDYLKRFEAETRFLNLFDPARVDALMQNISRYYTEDLINLAENVFRSAAGLYILKKDPFMLGISDTARVELENLLSAQDEQTLCDSFAQAAKYVCEKSGMNDYCAEYLHRLSKKAAHDVFLTLSTHMPLDTVFSSLALPSNDIGVYVDRVSMDDGLLRAVIEKAHALRHTSDKIALLTRYAQSLSDFLEIVNECFGESEFADVLKLLSDEEKDELVRRTHADAMYDICALSPFESYIFQEKIVRSHTVDNA